MFDFDIFGGYGVGSVFEMMHIFISKRWTS